MSQKLLIILFFIAPCFVIAQQVEPWTLTEIVDGDTIYAIDSNGEETKFRLIGIDAPESKHPFKSVQPYAHEATNELSQLLSDPMIYIEYDVQQKDRYGRTLAYIYNSKKVFVNNFLVKRGAAVVSTYPPNVKYVDLFTESQIYARENQIGLWGEATSNLE